MLILTGYTSCKNTKIQKIITILNNNNSFLITNFSISFSLKYFN